MKFDFLKTLPIENLKENLISHFKDIEFTDENHFIIFDIESGFKKLYSLEMVKQYVLKKEE